MTYEIFDIMADPHFSSYGKTYVGTTPVFSYRLITSQGNIIQPSTGANVIPQSADIKEITRMAEADSFPEGPFLVMKNADFTEGRGPMDPHKAFRSYDDAYNYIMSQAGVYGSPQRQSIRYGLNVYNQFYGSVDFNGYSIKTLEVL